MRLALAHLGRQESLPRLLKIPVPLVHQARKEGALVLLLLELVLGRQGEEDPPQALEALAEESMRVVAGHLAQGTGLGSSPRAPSTTRCIPFWLWERERRR